MMLRHEGVWKAIESDGYWDWSSGEGWDSYKLHGSLCYSPQIVTPEVVIMS